MTHAETYHRMSRSDLQCLAERAGMLLVEAEGGVLSFHEAKRPPAVVQLFTALAIAGLALATFAAVALAGGVLSGLWALAFRWVAW